MLKKLLFLSIFCPFCLIFGQKTTGKVYNATEMLEDVYVQNITRGEAQYTSENGDFSLNAEIGDSLIFSAPFYTTQKYKVQQYQLDEVWVVELKENLNELDAVQLTETKVKEFEAEKVSASLTQSFQEDYKLNPGKYGVGPKGNIGWILNKAIGLLKNKDKSEESGFISYDQLVALFESKGLFDEKLLSRQLEIPKEQHQLFLEFCATKKIDAHLLEEEKHFLLLDRLVNCSEEFRNFSNKIP